MGAAPMLPRGRCTSAPSSKQAVLRAVKLAVSKLARRVRCGSSDPFVIRGQRCRKPGDAHAGRRTLQLRQRGIPAAVHEHQPRPGQPGHRGALHVGRGDGCRGRCHCEAGARDRARRPCCATLRRGGSGSPAVRTAPRRPGGLFAATPRPPARSRVPPRAPPAGHAASRWNPGTPCRSRVLGASGRAGFEPRVAVRFQFEGERLVARLDDPPADSTCTKSGTM